MKGNENKIFEPLICKRKKKMRRRNFKNKWKWRGKTEVKLERNTNTRKREKIQTQKSVNIKDKKLSREISWDTTQGMANWMKVKDKEKPMKRSKGSEGSKEIRRNVDMTQNDAKARAQKKTQQQTRRFLKCSSKHTIVLRRKVKLISLHDVALHKERDVR